jgi:hypothetical protein
VCLETEDKDIVRADMIANVDIRSIEYSDRQRPIDANSASASSDQRAD